MSHKITFWSCTALVVSSMLGTGVYTSLGYQLVDIHSAFVILALWALGGALALCGALSYAELACMFPRSGGEYNLLSRIYHPSLGFASGVVSALVGFAAPAAIGAIAFGRYFSSVIPAVPEQVSGSFALVIMSAVHLRTLKFGSMVQRVLTAGNVVLIFTLSAAAFLFVGDPQADLLSVAGAAKYMWTSSFAVALMYVMYAYSGWNAPVYIGGEVEDVRGGLTQSLLIGTLIVMILYLGVHAAFLWSTPMDVMKGNLDVALIAGGHLLGPIGSRAVSAVICAGLLGCISSMMWVGPRVIETMGEDLSLLAWFSKLSSGGVPVRAILFQLGLALAFLLTSTFETVLLFTQTALLLSSLLCVVGVVALRVLRPDLERPYRCPAYPFTPLFFAAVTTFMIVYSAFEKPYASGLGLLLFGGSALSYFLIPRAGTRP